MLFDFDYIPTIVIQIEWELINSFYLFPSYYRLSLSSTEMVECFFFFFFFFFFSYYSSTTSITHEFLRLCVYISI